MECDSMAKLEHFLLRQYAERKNVDHNLVEEMFDILVKGGFDMNSVGTGGPLFCFIIDMRVILRIGIIIKMVDGGLDFNHIHMKGISHKKLFRELEIRYSDRLWGVFVYICQRTNFVETIPEDEMFEIIFGRIMVTHKGVKCEFSPHVSVIKLLLEYDVNKSIKKTFLLPINFSLRHCIKQAFPEILNEILNS